MSNEDTDLEPIEPWEEFWGKAVQARETMRYHEAEKFYKKALGACSGDHDLAIGYIALGLSELYLELQKNMAADVILSKAVQLMTESKPVVPSITLLSDIANIYAKIGLYQKAVHVAQLRQRLIALVVEEYQVVLFEDNKELLQKLIKMQEQSDAMSGSHADYMRDARKNYGALITELETLVASIPPAKR